MVSGRHLLVGSWFFRINPINSEKHSWVKIFQIPIHPKNSECLEMWVIKLWPLFIYSWHAKTSVVDLFFVFAFARKRHKGIYFDRIKNTLDFVSVRSAVAQIIVDERFRNDTKLSVSFVYQGQVLVENL